MQLLDVTNIFPKFIADIDYQGKLSAKGGETFLFRGGVQKKN